MTREQKITLGEMGASGVRDLLVYCSQYKCSHFAKISAERWPDHIWLSDLESLIFCQACGIKGADIKPDLPIIGATAAGTAAVGVGAAGYHGRL